MGRIMHKISNLTTPQRLLRVYWILFFFFVFLTIFCVVVPVGQKLAASVQYVTFISHLALVLSMLGAVEASKVVLAQNNDADVQDVLDIVKDSEQG